MPEISLAPPSLAEALDAVSIRFLVNLPLSELEDDGVRLFFQLQQGHWFYLDHLLPASGYTLPHFSLQDFAQQLVARCPVSGLAALAPHLSALHAQFKDYMGTVPSFGAILLNARMTRVLMLRPWRGRHWVFPKGKVNEGESDIACAARETEEEVGLPCAHLLRQGAVLTLRTGAKPIKFFIGVGAPDDGSFEYKPQSRCEVSEIGWFDVAKLPDDASRPDSHMFGAMLSLMRPLKSWIAAQKGSGGAAALTKKSSMKLRSAAAAAAAATGPPPPLAIPASGVSAGASPASGVGVAVRAGGHVDDGSLGGLMTPLSSTRAGSSTGGGAAGWSVADMFSANERLLKKTFVYDGNPHTFGDVRQRAVPAPAPAPAPALGKVKAKAKKAVSAPSAAKPAQSIEGSATVRSRSRRGQSGEAVAGVAALAAAAPAQARGVHAAPSIHDLPAAARIGGMPPFAFDMRAIAAAMGLAPASETLAAMLTAAAAAPPEQPVPAPAPAAEAAATALVVAAPDSDGLPAATGVATLAEG